MGVDALVFSFQRLTKQFTFRPILQMRRHSGKVPSITSPIVPPAGAKFELIRGAPEERFRRIVLQDTCLKVGTGRLWLLAGWVHMWLPACPPITLPTCLPLPPQDHLCSCYCWAVQQLMAGQEAQGQGQEAQVKEGSQGEQSKRKEE